MIKSILALIIVLSLNCTAAPPYAIGGVSHREWISFTNEYSRLDLNAVRYPEYTIDIAGLKLTIETNNFFNEDRLKDVVSIKNVGRFYARDIMCSNFLVLDTNAWYFTVPTVFSNSVDIITSGTGLYSAINYGFLTNYIEQFNFTTLGYATTNYVDEGISTMGQSLLNTLGGYTDDRVDILTLVMTEFIASNSISELTEYYKTNEVDTLLTEYYKTNEVDTLLTEYYKTNEVDTLLTEYYKTNEVDTLLTEYYKTNEVDTLLTEYYKTNEVDTMGQSVLNASGEYTDDRIDTLTLVMTEFCESNHNTEVYLNEGEKIYWVANDGSWTNWLSMNKTQMVMRINNNKFITE